MPLAIVKLKIAFKGNKINPLYKKFMKRQRCLSTIEEWQNEPYENTNLPLLASYNGFFSEVRM